MGSFWYQICGFHRLTSLLMICSILVIVIAVLFSVDFGLQEYPWPSHYKLVLGILSARENFHKREIIRNTWLQNIHEFQLQKKVLIKFVLGATDCNIPPTYRVEADLCKDEGNWQQFLEVDNGKEFLNWSQNYKTGVFDEDYHAVGIDFYVTHSIVIHSLAIPGSYCDSLNDPILVELRDIGNENQLVFASSFNISLCFKPRKGDILIQNVTKVLLPTRFQGSLVVRCNSGDVPCIGMKKSTQTSKPFQFVIYRPFIRYAIEENVIPVLTQPMRNEEMLFPAYLMYQVHDVKALQKHIRNRNHSFVKWRDHVKNINRRLAKEVRRHDDILIVGQSLVSRFSDLYRNLPKKLLQFYSTAYDSYNYDYIGKTDDDSFVNIYDIIEELNSYNDSAKNYWFGNFRHLVPVERTGKWREFIYSSIFYPDFACGSASIISRGISAWLNKNVNHLLGYQGEDVSMGIWLSAIDVIKKHNNKWICDHKCRPDMLASSQHNRSALLGLWENFRKCRNPCSCDTA